MSEMLSQDEIDALLRGGGASLKKKSVLSTEEISLLSEISDSTMNVISDYMLSRLKRNTAIKVSEIETATPENSVDLLNREIFGIEIDLTGGIKGKKTLLFKISDTGLINDLSIGGDGQGFGDDSYSEIHTEILLEQMKEIMPEAISAVSDIVKKDIEINNIRELPLGEKNETLKSYLENNEIVIVKYAMKIGDVLNSEVFELVPVSMVKEIVNLLLSPPPDKEDVPLVSTKIKGSKESKKEHKRRSENTKEPVVIQPVQFQSFDDDETAMGSDENIDFILDLPLQVSVELGKCKKTIKEILDLSVGSIVELDSVAEEFVDVLVNGKLIARGEVIVVDENFGIRIMELLTNNHQGITKC